MTPAPQPVRSRRLIPWRLLLLVLTLAPIAVIWTGLDHYQRHREDLQRTTGEQLGSVADLKVSEVARWRNELLDDANWILEASALPTAAERYFRDPSDRETRAYLQTWLSSWQRRHHYSRALLLDTNLQVRICAPEGVDWMGPLARTFAARALLTNQVLVPDLHLSPVSKQINMDLYIPLIPSAADGNPAPVVGLVQFEIDPEQFLFPHIQSWPSSSPTAETLLVRREGDEAVILNRLRRGTHAPLSLRSPLSDDRLPAVRAVLGQREFARCVDVGGTPVLAVTRSIPGSPWFIVAKVDEEEVMAPLQARAVTTGLIVVTVLAALGLAILLLWRLQEDEHVRQQRLEQDAAAAAIRQSEERFRSLYNSMTELVVLHELVKDETGRAVDYRILDCNQAFTAVTGIAREQAIGALASQIYGTGEAPFLATYARVAEVGQPTRFEAAFAPLQRQFDIAVCSPGPGQFATITTDITERKQSEQALRNSEALYHSLVEALPQSIVRKDAEGRFVYCNRNFCQWVGKTAEELLGTTDAALYPEELARKYREDDRIVLESGRTVEAVEETLDRGQQRRHVQVVKSAVRDARGQPVGVQVMFWDITERLQAERERERLLRELDQANQELEGLLYAASHDLRAPLVNIQGFSQRLARACAQLAANSSSDRPAVPAEETAEMILEHQIPKALRFIEAGVQKMDSLISGLLRVSRLGRLPLDRQPVDMDALLRRVLAAQGYQVQQAAADVRVDPLPTCVGDAALLDQVFANLIDNALKYRDPARPLRIHITGQATDGEVAYCVADTGMGIAPAHLEKVWDLFHRLHPERAVTGEGLGLSIIRRILDRHGGRAWTESTPGQGSRFFVALPSKPRS